MVSTGPRSRGAWECPTVLCPSTAPVLSAMGMLTMDVGRELTRAGVWDRTRGQRRADQRGLRPADATSSAPHSAGSASSRSRSDISARWRCATWASSTRSPSTFPRAISTRRPERRSRPASTIVTRSSTGTRCPWRAGRDPRMPPARRRSPAPLGRGGILRGGGERPARAPTKGARSCRIDGERRDVPVYRPRAARHGAQLRRPGSDRQLDEHRLRPGGVRAPRSSADGSLWPDPGRGGASAGSARPNRRRWRHERGEARRRACRRPDHALDRLARVPDDLPRDAPHDGPHRAELPDGPAAGPLGRRLEGGRLDRSRCRRACSTSSSGPGSRSSTSASTSATTSTPGDVILTNDPYHGGHAPHLPDWGFIRPIFYEGELMFFTLVRGHVMDTGGSFPGRLLPQRLRHPRRGPLHPADQGRSRRASSAATSST